ncbi:MAG: ORF6N domain-containing protein [Nitrospirota bacterium]
MGVKKPGRRGVVVPMERITQAIFLIRGQKVMLSTHLAELYEVEPRVLVQAVKRNIERFPEDFMFQLTWGEIANLKSLSVISRPADTVASRSQSVILKRGLNIKYPPYAFTEQGVAMLSSVLRSDRAIHVNIEIMRAFVRLRRFLATHKELADKLADLEGRLAAHDRQIGSIFEAIRQLMAPPEPKRRRIGFQVKEKRMRYGRGRRA